MKNINKISSNYSYTSVEQEDLVSLRVAVKQSLLSVREGGMLVVLLNAATFDKFSSSPREGERF